MTPNEISTNFAEASKRFEPIFGQPSINDLTKLREVLYKLLLIIPFDRQQGTHHLVRPIEADAMYAARHNGTPFPTVQTVGV